MAHSWNGPYGEPGQKETKELPARSTKVRGNKGVQRARQADKRTEAAQRNAQTLPERRRANRMDVVSEPRNERSNRRRTRKR